MDTDVEFVICNVEVTCVSFFLSQKSSLVASIDQGISHIAWCYSYPQQSVKAFIQLWYLSS